MSIKTLFVQKSDVYFPCLLNELPLERFPKSGNRFSDKKRGENKKLERFYLR